MPVTIKPSPDTVGRNKDVYATSAADLLAKAARAWSFNSTTGRGLETQPILRSSFNSTSFENQRTVPYANGFVHGIIRAFQQDLHLAIRPDDVWLAIITQFSFYVNAHAEELRKRFVKHEGEKVLRLDYPKFQDLDIGKVAHQFTCLIEKQLVDGDIRDWITPDFSTTTDNDIAVASIVMMATMKKYFSFEVRTGCGFPSVTLLGDVKDWEQIVRRLDRLAQYGEQPAEWASLLRPILTRFINTFADPESEELKDFWLHVCHVEGRESGKQETYSGWITALMYWNTEGERMIDVENNCDTHDRTVYELVGQQYPIVRKDHVPPGVIEVPVVVKAFERSTQYLTVVVAGSVGVTVYGNDQEDGEVVGKETLNGDKVQPLSGWWMLQVAEKPLLRSHEMKSRITETHACHSNGQ